MNKVILMGRLTGDPDIKCSQNSENPMTIARFTLAVDRRGRSGGEGQSADFISIVAFGKLGEFVEKYLSKGTKIILGGHIQTGSYTNRDGQKVYTTNVIAEEIEFAESKRSSEQSGTAIDTGFRMNSEQQGSTGWMNIPDGIDEELPFN